MANRKVGKSQDHADTLEWVKHAAGGATDLYLGYMAGKGGISWDELAALRKKAGPGKGHLSEAFFAESD